MAPDGRPPFPRIFAPMIQRPTSGLAHGLPHGVVSGAGQGFRSYSDQPFRAGDVLEVDVLLPDGTTVSGVVRVSWCDALPPGSPAGFDVGLAIARMDLADLARLDGVLRPRPEEARSAPAHGPAPLDVTLANAREVRDALRRLLDARDQFMAAVRSGPENLVPLREEDLYVAALSSARAVLSGQDLRP